MLDPSRIRGHLLLACALLAASAHAQEPEAPTRPKTTHHPIPQTVQSARWMAVTANRYATEAAAEMLKAGGSAVDAAIAAQWVLNLVEPQSSGIGGGGFMLLWNQQQQRLQALDGRETAPAALQPEDYRDVQGKPLPMADLIRQGKAVGVPGLVALMHQAHTQGGKLQWAQLFAPAIRLAESGFFVSARLQALLGNDRFLKDDVHAAELYYPNDEALTEGRFIRNPALAVMLRKLATLGPKAFYLGDTPRQIIDAINSKAGVPTRLTPADFEHYRAVERTPVCVRVREHEVCSMPPPSAGGIAVLQMLRWLEMQTSNSPLLNQDGDSVRWKAGALGPWLKASRLAYEDRLKFVGDPDRVDVPVARLLGTAYLQQRLSGFALTQGVPPDTTRPSTTHLSIVDAQGNAVALTSSIEDQFGSRIMVNGFLLNNQLTDFDLQSVGKAGAPNAIEPGKRPRSSMAPTLLLSTGSPRRVVGVIGSPGGPQIPSYIASRLYAHLWAGHAMSVAVAAPHITLRENRLDVETGLFDMRDIQTIRQLMPPGPARDELPVNFTPQTSGVHWIMRTPAGWQAVADPRREGSAIGE